MFDSTSKSTQAGLRGTPAAPALPAAAIASHVIARRLFGAFGADGNLVMSPWSIVQTLAGLRLGARAETAEQIDELLGIGHEELLADIRPARDLFASHRGGTGPNGEPTADVTLGNAFVTSPRLPIKPDYREALELRLGAIVRDACDAKAWIDEWISTMTHGRIRHCPVTIDSERGVVALDTVYFDALWAQPFETAWTHEESFTRADGSLATAAMMSDTRTIRYGRTAYAQRVELEYNAGWIMRLTLPEPGMPAEVVFDKIDLARTTVDLRLPAWRLGNDLNLMPALRALAPAAFAHGSPPADYSGIADRLTVQQVRQFADITVAEGGTTAAAATAVLAAYGGLPDFDAPRLPDVVFNRPFAYEVRHDETGISVFWSWVADPEADPTQMPPAV